MKTEHDYDLDCDDAALGIGKYAPRCEDCDEPCDETEKLCDDCKNLAIRRAEDGPDGDDGRDFT